MENGTTHDFTIVLSGVNYGDECLEDKLFEAGCDDCVVSGYNEIVYLAFDREAGTQEEAIKSAIKDAESASPEIVAKVADDQFLKMIYS